MNISVELRPCLVSGKKALFHRWGSDIAFNGLNERVGDIIIGIVEFEDGSVNTVYPVQIRFIDNKIKGYCFNEQEE
jgi:hypothetical protein